MRWALYDELTPWYRLLDATEDHADEVAHYVAELGAHEGPPVRTLLELGAGAGNNGAYLKLHYTCTLTDLSPAMLDLSRALNPECEHALGDMRTLRLERQFDAVLLHDALTYMRTEAELRQAAETAFVHTRPGGVAIFAPDCVVETFAEDTEVHEAEAGGRALRCLAWMWDPDPTDTEYTVDYVFMLREGGALRVVHDTHHEGLFDRTTWLRVLHEVGFRAEWRPRPGIEPGVYVPELLWAERPA
jgi:SAM-dependent methyltransferase